MKIERQVVSSEPALRLKEFGVKQDSIFWWGEASDGEVGIYLREDVEKSAEEFDGIVGINWICSAFAVAELGLLLPDKVCWRGYVHTGKIWFFSFGDGVDLGFTASAETEADMRAKMLIYLLEKKLITIHEIHEN